MNLSSIYRKNKLLWISIILIIIVDILNYASAAPKILLFVFFLVGLILLIFSLRILIWRNKIGTIVGSIISVLVGILSVSGGRQGLQILFFPWFLLLPIWKLLESIYGCSGG